jgi:hypothetical protein
MDPTTRRGKKFRRRFRMPMKNFREIMALIREEKWFPTYEKKNALHWIYWFWGVFGI